jgi:hypothetical protein
MKFRMDQMHLAQIGLARITRDPRTMLNGCTEMGVTLNAQSRKKADALLLRFGKAVRQATTHRRHDSMHWFVLPSHDDTSLLCSSFEKKHCFFLKHITVFQARPTCSRKEEMRGAQWNHVFC